MMAKILGNFLARTLERVLDHAVKKGRRPGGPSGSEPVSGPGIQVRMVDHFAVVRLDRPSSVVEGEVTGLLRARLGRLLEEGHLSQIIDLGEVDCVSATLVTCLALHYCRLRSRKGTLRLYGVGPRLTSALESCGLLGVLELYENEEAAIQGGNRLKFPS